LIEQAIFTSAETDRSAGYQLVGKSSGLSQADARELAVYGPSHGALLQEGPEAVSFNFHPLPSGAYCVSRTTIAGCEYSNRGAARVYTQCLVVPRDVLARFANNPFAVLRAALAHGSLEVFERVPRRLEPLHLVGRAASVDAAILARLSANPGADWLATLVQAALGSARLAVVGSDAAEHVIAGLINCLPPECRTEFSFSTGLKYSVGRPYRILTLSDDKAQWRRMHRQHNMVVLDLSGDPPAEFAPFDGWARLIHRVLRSGQTSFLAAQFSKRRFKLMPDDLPALGLQLLEELDASALPDEPSPAGKPSCQSLHETGPGNDWLDGLQRAHAAHRRFQGSKGASVATAGKSGVPSKCLPPDSPEVLEKLELLDDLVFEAIGGKRSALEQLRILWPQLRGELGDKLLAESREQYLRRALSIWEDCVQPDQLRQADRAVGALDVLCVLFDEL